MEGRHDEVFLKILQEEKNIANFLNAFFGFLYRCTDFYFDSSPGQKLGFPPGIAEKIVTTTLHKWKHKYSTEQLNSTSHGVMQGTTQDIKSKSLTSQSAAITQDIGAPAVARELETKSTEGYVAAIQPPDSYNGAMRENYTWSQTISDLDVSIKIPWVVKTSKDLKVDVTSQEIQIAIKTTGLAKKSSLITNLEKSEIQDFSTRPEWTIIFRGQLCFKIRKEESIWSLIPGQYINIHLEKASERWWEAFIEGEPKIELNKIDCSRNLEDLSSTEQMKIQELMWNHQQKLLGKPTSDQINAEKILKQGWNVEGSPFKGTPYDPSVLKFN
ncbi:nudC domain-containing protein 3 isoform X2 [Orussus abietinus]|uniref:nudC domain-containing protein 3 isoform X2 n=1 Tax=Orussus abietinus TaxID=222816 RepID=UPI000626D10B|nr:nudC domain-containing protein 3 isoform X2 [Orussus abietinus]